MRCVRHGVLLAETAGGESGAALGLGQVDLAKGVRVAVDQRASPVSVVLALLSGGVEAVGVTLSVEQAALAREKIAARGLADKVSVQVIDYNDLESESFDTISSIGMFEAVGIDNHQTYFKAVHRLLKPGGLYLHHAISRPARGTDSQFRKMRAEYRALVRYIFPGGELDHLGMSIANLERARFEVHDVEGWRMH